MNPGSTPEHSDRIDRACDAFEAAWMRGEAPRIEDYLGGADPGLAAGFLTELLLIELAYRRGRGEMPAAPEYAARFPGRSAAIDAAFTRGSTVTYAIGAPAAGGAAVTPPPTQMVLAVVSGPHEGRAFTIEGHDAFVVGRGKGAHFQLPEKDAFFSRFHFLIEFNPPLCRLLDLGSTNHTYVNGKKVAGIDLHHGDRIVAGKTAISVTIREVPDDNPPAGESEALDEHPATMTFRPVDTKPASAVIAPQRGCVACNGNGNGEDPGPATGLCERCLSAIRDRSTKIGGYGIIRELGRGGMGVVYLAARLDDGAVVAVKSIRTGGAATERELARFVREAKILRDIGHDRIVRFLDADESGGQLFYAMEYVPGLDAAGMSRQAGPIEVERAVGWACQALEGLEYAHDRRYVHRDIKPSNLLVSGRPGSEVVKVTDFGLARVYEASRISGLTLSGDIGGTLEFMAPEQITNFRDARPPADLYGIGATLYYLLTNKHIYDLPARVELRILAILQEPPVPIRNRRPDLPAGLVEAIGRALAREPSDRFPDARSMRLALESSCSRPPRPDR